jgi:hypothetical protein
MPSTLRYEEGCEGTWIVFWIAVGHSFGWAAGESILSCHPTNTLFAIVSNPLHFTINTLAHVDDVMTGMSRVESRNARFVELGTMIACDGYFVSRKVDNREMRVQLVVFFLLGGLRWGRCFLLGSK